MPDGITATVSKMPLCDICKLAKLETLAAYDGKTTRGPWAYMCEPHFVEFGIGLGTGLGQRLILA